MKKNFKAPFFLFILPIAVQGGALVTTNHQVEVGEIKETPSGLSVPNPYGAVEYKKGQVLWFTTAPEIDTLFKAAQKAQADGNLDAARTLYQQSVSREPATANEAQTALSSLNVTGPGGGLGNEAPDARKAAEDKIARGKQMIADGQQLAASPHLSTGTLGAGGKSQGVNDNKANLDAQQRIADGQKLVDEGAKELQAIETEEAAKKAEEEKKVAEAEQKHKETQQVIEEVKKDWDAKGSLASRSPEEKWVNMGVGAGFALLVLFALWQITMLEPKKP